MIKDLDKAFIWEKAFSPQKTDAPKIPGISNEMNQWTALVFGECGQGKSTTLNEIVDVVVEKYYKGIEHGCKFKSM